MRIPLLDDGTQSQESSVRRMADGAAESLRVVVRSLTERAESDSNTSTNSYTPASVSRTQNVAIALGVILPVGGAMIVLYFLHRKHLKKQRAEDMNDPHKSLDFGMDGLPPGTQGGKRSRKGNKGPPEMIVTDLGGATGRPSRRGHGMSFDMGMESPYLLPGGMQSSRESIHSMSRQFNEHDPYRPVTMMRPSSDTDRYRHGDNGSVHSLNNSLMAHERAGLTANARPMSITPSQRNSPVVSQPPTPGSLSPRDSHSPVYRARSPLGKPVSLDEKTDFEIELQQLHSPPAVPEPVVLMMPPPRKSSTLPIPPRTDSIPQAARPRSSIYGEDDVRASAMPDVVIDEPYDMDPSSIYADYSVESPVEHNDGGLALHAPQPQRLSVIAAGSRLSIVDAQRLSVAGGNRLSIMGAGNRLSVMGARPLPQDMPEDNPEVRANRIRSFYKEYFDDSKPLPANAYYEDEYNNDLHDGVYYDPDSGGFFAPDGPHHSGHSMPYAQPPGRRAMTPPPRQKPRVSGPNSPLGPGYYPNQHFRKFSSHSTMSGGGRPHNFGARGRPMVPAKKLPPPLPLQSLPTPHKLGSDVWISNPIDFAPPSSVRTVQNGGRPDSPFGSIQRPYSPSVRAFTPLASSFDVLAVLPSPHDLRRSGTFTALDFAPPSRMRDPAGGSRPGSAAGSLRSTRSGISAVQQHAMQKGAYRVSRIPKEMVGSREDLGNMLRPRMDMVSRG